MMMPHGDSVRAAASRSAAERTIRTLRPAARAAPDTRLKKIRSSQSIRPRATGDTVAAVEQEIREAIRFHIDGLKADGLPVPAPTSIAEYVEA